MFLIPWEKPQVPNLDVEMRNVISIFLTSKWNGCIYSKWSWIQDSFKQWLLWGSGDFNMGYCSSLSPTNSYLYSLDLKLQQLQDSFVLWIIIITACCSNNIYLSFVLFFLYILWSLILIFHFLNISCLYLFAIYSMYELQSPDYECS